MFCHFKWNVEILPRYLSLHSPSSCCATSTYIENPMRRCYNFCSRTMYLKAIRRRVMGWVHSSPYTSALLLHEHSLSPSGTTSLLATAFPSAVLSRQVWYPKPSLVGKYLSSTSLEFCVHSSFLSAREGYYAVSFWPCSF